MPKIDTPHIPSTNASHHTDIFKMDTLYNFQSFFSLSLSLSCSCCLSLSFSHPFPLVFYLSLSLSLSFSLSPFAVVCGRFRFKRIGIPDKVLFDYSTTFGGGKSGGGGEGVGFLS